jgi:N-acetylglucosaminyl-diphospho-decaprenol L-rhamnosyltransferase
MLPTLDIVIVNWNTGDDLRACLKTLAATNRSTVTVNRVVVVDNASSDGSAENLDAGDLRLVVIKNHENRGFAAACNQGAAGSNSNYVLFLNPDTLPPRDALSKPVLFLEDPARHDIGICGVQMVDDHGQPSTSCARFPTPTVIFGEATGLSRIMPAVFKPQLMKPQECVTSGHVDQIIGAFFLVRGDLFRRLGGFDERFFMYSEEVDFSFRAAQRGFRSYLLNDVTVAHAGGRSSRQVRAARLFYMLRSRTKYAFKHYSRPVALLLAVLTVAVELPLRLVRGVAHRSLTECFETLHAYHLLVADWTRGGTGPAV